MSDAEQAAASFFEEIGLKKKTATITDYKERDIVVNRHAITNHTDPKKTDYVDRHLYIKDILKVINQPDEVWVNNHTIVKVVDSSKTFNSYSYIKYYKNKIIKVVCNLNADGSLELSTWYEAVIDNLGNNDKMQNGLYRHRRGLPVKK